MTRVVIADGVAAAAEFAADLIAAEIVARPDLVLGVATGSTPLPTWRALARRGLDLGELRAFALDEYLGLAPGHPQLYSEVIDREITSTLALDPARVHTPATDGDLDEAPARYEAAIEAAGGVDVQVLGIGRNGHIGFNEPGSSLSAPTHIARLSEQTRYDNARFFASLDEVPTWCITQGIGTIRRARRLLLLAFGEHKAEAVAAAVEGPVSAGVPASAIQLHPDVTVVVDEMAAKDLANATYYRAAWPPVTGDVALSR